MREVIDKGLPATSFQFPASFYWKLETGDWKLV